MIQTSSLMFRAATRELSSKQHELTTENDLKEQYYEAGGSRATAGAA
jgi:hypothetical protein